MTRAVCARLGYRDFFGSYNNYTACMKYTQSAYF